MPSQPVHARPSPSAGSCSWGGRTTAELCATFRASASTGGPPRQPHRPKRGHRESEAVSIVRTIPRSRAALPSLPKCGTKWRPARSAISSGAASDERPSCEPREGAVRTPRHVCAFCTRCPDRCPGPDFRASITAICREKASTATGIRTRVSAVRGRRPSPLDDSGREVGERSETSAAGPCRCAVANVFGPSRGCGEIGKHAAFRSPCPYGLGGSSPFSRIRKSPACRRVSTLWIGHESWIGATITASSAPAVLSLTEDHPAACAGTGTSGRGRSTSQIRSVRMSAHPDPGAMRQWVERVLQGVRERSDREDLRDRL